MLHNYLVRVFQFYKNWKENQSPHTNLSSSKLFLARLCFCLLFQMRFVKQWRMNLRFILSEHFDKLLKERRKFAAAGGWSLSRVLTPLEGVEARQIDLV